MMKKKNLIVPLGGRKTGNWRLRGGCRLTGAHCCGRGQRETALGHLECAEGIPWLEVA